jgi:hypothetical protein
MMNQNTVDTIESDLSFFSDMYKDIHGIRPRWMYEQFRSMSPIQRQAEIDRLCEQTLAETDESLANVASEQLAIYTEVKMGTPLFEFLKRSGLEV